MLAVSGYLYISLLLILLSQSSMGFSQGKSYHGWLMFLSISDPFFSRIQCFKPVIGHSPAPFSSSSQPVHLMSVSAVCPFCLKFSVCCFQSSFFSRYWNSEWDVPVLEWTGFFYCNRRNNWLMLSSHPSFFPHSCFERWYPTRIVWILCLFCASYMFTQS